MRYDGWRGGVVGLAVLAWACVAPGKARAQSPPTASPQGATTMTADQLVRMAPCQLDQIYRQGGLAAIAPGKIRGRAVVWPGSKFAGAASRCARVAWQGKVFLPGGTSAVNRFFGVRMIRGNLYQGTSWMDGNPALILDYQETSLLYRPYRDEIREVAPGLYLGLMYARTCPEPTFKMYFVLDSSCRGG